MTGKQPLLDITMNETFMRDEIGPMSTKNLNDIYPIQYPNSSAYNTYSSVKRHVGK